MDRSKDQSKVNTECTDANKNKGSCCTDQQKVSLSDPKQVHIAAPPHDKKYDYKLWRQI